MESIRFRDIVLLTVPLIITIILSAVGATWMVSQTIHTEIRGVETRLKAEIQTVKIELQVDINRINDRIDRHIESVRHSAMIDSQAVDFASVSH